jgi:hypothetical protein
MQTDPVKAAFLDVSSSIRRHKKERSMGLPCTLDQKRNERVLERK